MNANDPNVQRVEIVATALGDLCDELVLVGGCAASLLIDAPAAPPPRVTYDVDLIARVAALSAYHDLERRFERRGFQHDLSPDAPQCRWVLGTIKIDLMPTEERVLGFSNRWYPEAARSASRVALPAGNVINLISAPAFLATKFEAFHSRGKADMAMSHDLEDIVNVIEGRAAILVEVQAAETTLRQYLARQLVSLARSPDFDNVLPGLVTHDALHRERIAVIKRRLGAIAAMG